MGWPASFASDTMDFCWAMVLIRRFEQLRRSGYCCPQPSISVLRPCIAQMTQCMLSRSGSLRRCALSGPLGATVARSSSNEMVRSTPLAKVKGPPSLASEHLSLVAAHPHDLVAQGCATLSTRHPAVRVFALSAHACTSQSSRRHGLCFETPRPTRILRPVPSKP